MANFYGQPLTEEERRRQMLESMYSVRPPGVAVDTHAPPSTFDAAATQALGVSGPEPAPLVPPPTVDESLAIAGDPYEGALALPDAPDNDPFAMPSGPPEREGMNVGQGIAIGLGGLADMASVLSRGRSPGGNAAAIAGQVNSNIAQRQARQDAIWRQQVADHIRNRRLGIGEAQEARAAQEHADMRSAGGNLGRLIQEDLRRKVAAGELQLTEEQIAGMTPQAYDALNLGGEASAHRGVQLNNQMADAAVGRRLGADAIDAAQQVEALRAIGYNVPDTASPEAVDKIFSKLMADERYAAQLQNSMALKRGQGGGKGDGFGRPFMSTAELISAPDHVKTEYLTDLERYVSTATEAQDRLIGQFQLQQAQNVANRQIDGLQFVGDVVPSEKQYTQAVALKSDMDEFEKKTNEGLRLLEEIDKESMSTVGRFVPGTDAYAMMKELHSVQEQREAIGRRIYGFGAPQAHEQMPIKNAVGDMTSLIGQATGTAKSVAQNNIRLTNETALGHLRSLQYVPGGDDPGRRAQQTGGGALSPEEEAELEELERMYGGAR